MSETVNTQNIEVSSTETNENKIVEKENEINQPILLEHLENPPKKLPENSEENKNNSKYKLIQYLIN